jgi:xanthine dehydrogenase YagT iron-sulfur-binding subunit
MHSMNDTKEPGGMSRRRFLQGSGLAAAATAASGLAAEALPGLSAAQPEPAVPAMGPGAVKITLNVNGRKMATAVEPRVTLLDALRNYLDVTGCKRVCDRGTCGACTMIVDGRTVYSCSTLAIEVQGKQIRTVDGLANGATLHPVQQAFCDVDALMCGFCTPGFVVATVALLEKHPNATPEQMRQGLDGNICRCGTFVRILEAANAAKAKGVARG